MIYAKHETGQRIEPTPGAKAICPTCNEEVIAKCGSINRWHWSHRGDTDCDPWSEHETEWHLGWKDHFTKAEQEVVMGPHRADILTRSGRVIELQHSQISSEEIKDREAFYGPGMVWVLDASKFILNMEFYESHGGHFFRWKWFRKTWANSRRPIFLDPGKVAQGKFRDKLFHLKKLDFTYNVYGTTGQGGWGTWGCKFEFLRFFGAKTTLNHDFMERFSRMSERGDYAPRP
jgi:competence protein CoiA